MDKYRDIRDNLIEIYTEINIDSANEVEREAVKREIRSLGQKFINHLLDEPCETGAHYLRQIEILAAVCHKHILLLQEKRDARLEAIKEFNHAHKIT